VQDIAVEYEWQGLSPEQICHEHPGLTLAQVHAALAYYYDHRDEIQKQIEADDKYVEQLRRERSSGAGDSPESTGK
jgi:hypothetical protein